MGSYEEAVRRSEDRKIDQVAEILDVVDQAARYRRLIQELQNPPPDIVESYRSMALQIFSTLERIAKDVVEQDHQDRAYDG